jgi:hypothetical protein
MRWHYFEKDTPWFPWAFFPCLADNLTLCVRYKRLNFLFYFFKWSIENYISCEEMAHNHKAPTSKWIKLLESDLDKEGPLTHNHNKLSLFPKSQKWWNNPFSKFLILSLTYHIPKFPTGIPNLPSLWNWCNSDKFISFLLKFLIYTSSLLLYSCFCIRPG